MSSSKQLVRPKIIFHSITLNGSQKLNETSDQFPQLGLQASQRRNYQQKEHKSMQMKIVPSFLEDTKQTLPFLNLKQIENSSFLSIDEASLSSKFSKVPKPKDNRILTRHLTQVPSNDIEPIEVKATLTPQGQDEYYKYWKRKAHQYLDENFKLREENRKLKTELSILQKTKRVEQSVENKSQIQDQSLKISEKSYLYLESLFKKKLEELQNELKQKNLKIVTLQDHLLQINRKLLGEQERTKLIQKLGTQVETLSKQNIFLKKQLQQKEKKRNSFEALQTKYQNSNVQQQKQKKAQSAKINRRPPEILYRKNKNR